MSTKLIRKAAVIGSGTMGSGIAAHLANAGVPCLLLDIVPADAAGATKTERAARSRLAVEAIQRQLKGRPGGFFEPGNAELVQAGNVEDDLDGLRDCDWIVEAVTEKVEIKTELYRKIAPYRREDAIVSSNTSGISLQILTEGLDNGFRQHFLITHFFNPPRYLYLLELVPGPDTLPEVYDSIADFADRRLGKGIVACKDTPNFIGNRIGVYGMASCAHLTEEFGLSFEEVDAITGRALGRPKTASYRLQDLVGLDVSLFVMENVGRLLPDDESRDLFRPPELFRRMVEAGRLGKKSGEGFYKKVGKEILVLDRETFEYRPQREIRFASLKDLKKIPDAGERIRRLLSADDEAARFAWKHLAGTLCYSARRIPEISDDVVSIDRAMRWGYAWEIGPFEIWDAIGVRDSVQRMRQEGIDVPGSVTDMLSKGRETFYDHDGRSTTYFDFASGEGRSVPERRGVLLLGELRKASSPVDFNDAASLWDVGEGVLCVEFHSKMNSITGDTLDMIARGVDRVEREDYAGLVIGNQAANFSVGANIELLARSARDGDWDAIDKMIRQFHDTVLRMRYCHRPVVVSTQGMALGGGCEIPMAGHRVQAAAETYMGLVELGVGLIPAGGGTRELACRAHESVPENVAADIFPYIRRAFETVAMAKTSTSAAEARALGFLRDVDVVTPNRDRALAEARRTVVYLAEEGFAPPPRRRAVRVVGRQGLAELQVILHQYRQGGFVSEYDVQLATRLGRVLCGGEVDDTLRVDEQYLLDLERETFLGLCGEEKTLERIQHTLKTGKPLRN